MKHDYHDRDDGLQHCKVCNGGEGSLPTECPGKRMTEAEEAQVYAGTLDYRSGKWVDATNYVRPLDMVLHCPKCHTQHVDAPDRLEDIVHTQSGTVVDQVWTNPPHRSHLCHSCGCVWRPADVPTNGVREIKTRGKADTWSPTNQTKGGA